MKWCFPQASPYFPASALLLILPEALFSPTTTFQYDVKVKHQCQRVNPHPAPVLSCSPGNTLHAPATTGLASQPVASLWTSVLCPYGGHITPGLLPVMTRSLQTALRLALAQGLPVAWPPLLPWAALSPSQPSFSLSLRGQAAWWLDGSPRSSQLPPCLLRAHTP